jgi:phenylacetaldehyde dehydrogenase
MSIDSFLTFSSYELLPSVRDFLSRPIQNFIDGEWVDAQSGKIFEKRDPATNEVIAGVAQSEGEDVDRAVASARRAFESPEWSTMPTGQRQDMLLRFAALLEANSEELTQIECLDNGSSVSRGSSMMMANFVRYFAGLATKVYGDTLVPTIGFPGIDLQAYTLRQPVGVVAGIIPWNGPSLMWITKVIPAIALGCTVVIKPASDTPLVGTRYMDLLVQAGLPRGVVNQIQGLGSVAGASLAAHPGINKVSFTGSTEVGMAIGKAAIGNMTRTTLELGGKSPSIIFDDADLSMAPFLAATSIFMNCGQICIAGSRLFVQKKSFDRVMAAIQDRAQTLKVGPGMNPEAEMGPLINPKQKTRVLGFIEDGVDSGAKLLAGGQGIDRPGNFVQPTVFVDVDDSSPIYREEIFGPVLVASPFDGIQDVARRANDTPFGLAANIWTANLSNAHKLARMLDAGTVTINTGTFPPDPNMPFGGFKLSGFGRENGKSAIDLFTESKTVIMGL